MIGVLTALVLLGGRWDLSRIAGSEVEEGNMLLQPRLWLVIALLLLVVVQAIRPGKLARVRLAGSDLWLLALFSLLLVSLNWAPDQPETYTKGLEVALEATAILLLVVSRSIFERSRVETAFWTTLLVTGLLLAFFAITSNTGDRIGALGGGPITFGRNMGLMGLAAWRLAEVRNGVYRWWAGGVMVLALLLILMSGSRGALLSFCLGCLLLLFLSRLPVWQKATAIVSLASLLGVVLTTTNLGHKATEVFDRRIVEVTFHRQDVSGRDDLWCTAEQLAIEKPWFGWGLNGFAANSWHYPHNLILEVLVETGGIGLTLLALASASFSWRFWTYRRQMPAATAAAVLLAFTSAQTSGDLYDSRCFFLLLVMATPSIVVREVACRRPVLIVQPLSPSIVAGS